MRRGLLVLAATLLLAAPAAAAQCPQTTLGDVEDEVMCPVCGTPLGLATEAPQAQRERELIERLIADCQSKEEIKARLVAEFGDEVLAEPDDEGFDLAAWLIPGLAVLLGLLGVGAAALRWRRRAGGDAAAADPAPSSKRLDTDLERYDL
jgi:cytochrome c-type biogenesis protein CcmH